MTITRWTSGLLAMALFAAGGATTYFAVGGGGRGRSDTVATSGRAAGAPSSAETPHPAAGVLEVDAESMRRSGIEIEKVGSGRSTAGLSLPGTVQPNANRKVAVTPLVAGRVVRVPVELGQHVTPGTLIAEVYSPEVEEARTRYSTMRADAEAGEAKLTRTEQLAKLGSASQQELEEVRAEHVRHQTELKQAAARLHLLGIDPSRAGSQDDVAGSTLRVTAPQAGVIVERPASVGMTAEPSTVLATVADLSPVWIVADVYERDFARASVGTIATVTAEAFPGLVLHGRVAYVSSDVRPETRTAQVRIEVPNPGGKLRFGMYVNVVLGEPPAAAGLIVQRSAIQTIGPDNVVFVADESVPGRFHERTVTLGDSAGDAVTVATGLSEGDRIATHGTFALRAEAVRQGIMPAALRAASTARPSDVDVISVAITNRGFEPSTLKLSEGRPARITFTRKTDVTCATDIELPDYGIRRPLPLDEPVTVTITPKADTTAGFQCAMGMIKGAIVVAGERSR